MTWLKMRPRNGKMATANEAHLTFGTGAVVVNKGAAFVGRVDVPDDERPAMTEEHEHEHPAPHEHPAYGFIVPPWFLKIMALTYTLFALTFLPWAIWQTRLGFRVEVKLEQFDELAREVRHIEDRLPPEFPPQRFEQTMNARFDEIHRRLDRLEAE
jgi:hypothetical protein